MLSGDDSLTLPMLAVGAEGVVSVIGNLVPRDIATREIFQVCTELGLGVGGGNMVYLDLRDQVKAIGRAAILAKLEGILEIY